MDKKRYLYSMITAATIVLVTLVLAHLFYLQKVDCTKVLYFFPPCLIGMAFANYYLVKKLGKSHNISLALYSFSFAAVVGIFGGNIPIVLAIGFFVTSLACSSYYVTGENIPDVSEFEISSNDLKKWYRPFVISMKVFFHIFSFGLFKNPPGILIALAPVSVFLIIHIPVRYMFF